MPPSSTRSSAKLSALKIQTAEVFLPLLEPARYKGAWGGRGSGKSHFFAESLIEDGLRWPGEAGEGLRALSFREVQKSLKESAKFLLESKLRKLGLTEADGFKVFTDRIATPGDGVIAFTGMQDHTADSVKSYEGFHRAWGEEAQSISDRSMTLLRPTIRWEDTTRGLESELWFSWNPRRKSDAVDVALRQNRPANATVIRANWSDNPWFPKVLEAERLDCLEKTPDQYDHIWEGGYATAISGAYYASALQKARAEKRVGNVAVDPVMPLKAFWDIGVSDATAIWVGQWVGRELRFVDYYEAVGQPLSVHLAWLRAQGYGAATCYLPHDGDKRDVVTAIRFEDHIRSAGFECITVPNQGRGAAMKRVEAARRLFPAMWFDGKCEPGLDALGWYHEKRDEDRQIGLGPEHDWSSHGADAFGLAAVAYELPQREQSVTFKRRKVV